MKKTTGWAFASMAIAALAAAACTTDVTDTDSEGGVNAGGSAGSAGSAAGAAGSSTSDSGTTEGGGGTTTTEGGGEMSACEKCAYAKCKAETDACEADTNAAKNGCGDHVDEFYTCFMTATDSTKIENCANDFVNGIDMTGGSPSQGLASELTGCLQDVDPTKGCLSECMAGGGSDGGTTSDAGGSDAGQD